MWKYFGVFCNALTVVLGSCLGLLIRARAGKSGAAGAVREEKLSEKMMECMGFVTVFAAASGLLEVESSIQALICVASMVAGFALGWLLRLSDRLDSLGDWAQRRFSAGDGEEGGNPAEGFVTAFLLFCVGSMTVLGSFESAANPPGGLELGCHTTLMIKSLMDFTSATCLAASFGASVMLAGAGLLVFQGALVFLASTIQPFLLRINAMPMINGVGSLLLLGIALNLIGIKKIKTADYLPALFMPILICAVIAALGGRV